MVDFLTNYEPIIVRGDNIDFGFSDPVLSADLNSDYRSYLTDFNKIFDNNRNHNLFSHTPSWDYAGQPIEEVTPSTSHKVSGLGEAIQKWADIPYKFGRSSKTGIDCSAFTQNVFKEMGIDLPRTAAKQYSATQRIDMKDLKPGDLVFLKGTWRDGISHVGIVVDTSELSEGKIKVAEASGKKSSKENTWDLNSGYHKKHWAGAGRIRQATFAQEGAKLPASNFLTNGEDISYPEARPTGTDYSKYLRVSYLENPMIKVTDFLNPRVHSVTESPFYAPPTTDNQRVSIAVPRTYSPTAEYKATVSGRERPKLVPMSLEAILNNLAMEGKYVHDSGDFIARREAQFGEKFVTGPYGQVYKYIDEKGNLLSNPIPFKEGERVSPEFALANAQAYYEQKATRWLNLLEGKEGLTQDKLDALVSASGGTKKATQKLEEIVLNNWGNWQAIADKWKRFAVTAAGNGKVMPGLLSRRYWESEWFLGNKHPYQYWQQQQRDGKIPRAQFGGTLWNKIN